MTAQTKFRRIWYDVSFTRTQQGSIGITRTVRRLFAGELPAGAEALAMAYHSGGFRRVPFPPPQQQPARARASTGERLFSLVTGGVVRKLVILALRALPWGLLRPAWEASANLTFDALSKDAEPARFQAGDAIVIADVAWNYPVWRAACAARRQGAVVLLLVYDLMPVRQPQFCFPLVPKLFATFLARMLACSDAVLCISRATESDLRRWADEERVRLPPTGHFRLGSDMLPSAATVALVRPAIADFLAATPRCFAAVGSFEPKKNYALMVAVFDRLWTRGERVRLVIAGKETPEMAGWTAALRSHPQQGRLLMTIHDATDAEIDAIYAGCRALVFPSLFEGFGLPLVEARLRGCRVIASDIPAFVELADEGVLLFASGNGCSFERALLEAEDLPPASAAEPFTWQQSVDQFHVVAGSLLARD